MKEKGIDLTGHYPKKVDEFLGESFDYVITVCGGAKENCPVFTGNVRQNGDNNRTSVAGSVEVCAQFHIADFQTAGVRSATKSSTNLTDVLIPKNALISKVQVTCTNAGFRFSRCSCRSFRC